MTASGLLHTMQRGITTSAHASPVIDVSENLLSFMKIIHTALAMMLSVACFTGCDANETLDAEALQVELDDADIAAQSDDEDFESAFETELDLIDDSNPARTQTCAQWTPPPGLCRQADILCEDPEETPGPCATLTQCFKCTPDWGGGEG